MWFPSRELMDNMVGMMSVINEPDLYPKDVVAALHDLHEGRSSFDFKTMYSFQGYIISTGTVGIRHDAPQKVKEEWMRYWERVRDNPFINF